MKEFLKTNIIKSDIVKILNYEGDDTQELFEYSQSIKRKFVKEIVYFRGLIELSNICSKDCLYCGIRKSNDNIERYTLTDDEVVEASVFAYKNKFGSVVLQAGELISPNYVDHISALLKKIHVATSDNLRITLSLGEQTYDTYSEWFKNGAARYLLRIETTNSKLYRKLHPVDDNHNHKKRLEALQNLRNIGYQVGTGVMIGLPFQTISDMADDLLFMKDSDIHMVGMGPYLEHKDTPLYEYSSHIPSSQQRFDLTLKMIAILRIMMKDINIAATTALQSIDKMGREKAIKIGANVIMPNITPGRYRNNYKLYDKKPCTDENADDCLECLTNRISMTNNDIGFNEWGDSRHFKSKLI